MNRPQDHNAAGRIMSMKNSNDTIGYRTRNLPACSAVPQPTAPPRGPNKYSMSILIIFWSLKCGHLPHITLLPHRNLRWLLDFWKIFTPPNLRRNVSKFKKIVSQKNEVSWNFRPCGGRGWDIYVSDHSNVSLRPFTTKKQVAQKWQYIFIRIYDVRWQKTVFCMTNAVRTLTLRLPD